MTDLELLKELKNGNQTCLKYLYGFLPDVRRFIVQNSGDEDDAKDLLQDAIIVFYKNVMNDQYQSRNLKGYILTVVKHQWFDRLDKLKRQKNKLPELMVEEAQEDSEFELAKSSMSLSEYMRQALDKLGDPCRALIRATVFLKIRMEQIAADFGYADAHSARQQKLKCLKRLRLSTSYEDIINLA